MRLELKKMILNNFKGIKKLELDFGKRTSIYATNGRGKTSIADAFFWLLTDKNKEGKSDFDLETKDRNGDIIHGLEHSVEATFLKDGAEWTIKKIYKEDWTKKRGTAEAVLTGHTKTYYVDGVPMKKQKDWDIALGKVFDIEQLKLLTNPLFFNSDSFDWKKRRELIMSVCGSIDDMEIIQNDPSLKELLEYLNGKDIESFKAIVKGKKESVNAELKDIPVRIDELIKSVSSGGVESAGKAELLVKIETCTKQQNALYSEISAVENGSAISAKQVRIGEIDNEIGALANAHKEAERKAKEAKQIEHSQKSVELSELERKISALNTEKLLLENDIEKNGKERKSLLGKYHDLKEKIYDGKDNCPTCGQRLPEDKIHEAIEEFNKTKSDTMESIILIGKEFADKIKEGETKKSDIEKQLADLSAQKVSLEQYLSNLKNEISAIIVPDDSADKVQALNDEKETVIKEITNLRESMQTVIKEKRTKAQEIETQAAEYRKQIAAIDAAEATKKRIEELKGKERDLSQQYSLLEKQTYLVEEFTKKKVSFTEQAVNKKFKLAKFLMFDIQVNGGLKDTCQATLEGIPWPDINDSGKVAVGLDICNTLAVHYDMYLPIVVDNAEGIVVMPRTESQLIATYVSGADEKIRVEVEE